MALGPAEGVDAAHVAAALAHAGVGALVVVAGLVAGAVGVVLSTVQTLHCLLCAAHLGWQWLWHAGNIGHWPMFRK